MPVLLSIFPKIWALLNGSAFFWKALRNYGKIKNLFEVVSQVLNDMHARGDSLPDCNETSKLASVFSEAFKADIIDLPYLDEYQLALVLDKINANLVCSIEDKKTGKTQTLAIKSNGPKMSVKVE